MEYAGVMKKSLNCGCAIGPYDAICPCCNYVISDRSINNSTERFKEKQEKISDEMNSSRNIFNQKAKANRRKLEIISSFPVPNIVEDITEMLLALSAMVNSFFYYTSIQNKRNDEEIENLNIVLEGKLTQFYNKEKISFGNTDKFHAVESVCLEAIEKINKRKKRKNLMITATIGSFIVSFAVFVFIIAITNKYSIKVKP